MEVKHCPGCNTLRAAEAVRHTVVLAQGTTLEVCDECRRRLRREQGRASRGDLVTEVRRELASL